MLKNNLIGDWYYTQEELESFSFKKLGNNVLIKKNVTIFNPSNIVLGDNVRIEDWVLMTASGEVGIQIGSNVHIASGCIMFGGGGIDIGNFCVLAPRVSLISISDDYTGNSLTGLCVPLELRQPVKGKITLGKHVIIGINSTVLPLVTIGEGVSIGAHSLVNKSLPPWGVFCGTPARMIRQRSQKLLDLEEKYYSNEF